jgi:hypothetical protein
MWANQPGAEVISRDSVVQSADVQSSAPSDGLYSTSRRLLMTGKAGLKAGLIGAAIILVLTLLSQIPTVGCVCCPLTFLVYAGIGALAGFFLTPPRTAGAGAGAGAIAGLISGAVSGLAWSIIMAIQMALTGSEEIVSAIDPQAMQQLAELGVDIDPEMLALFSGAGGVALAGSMCCLTGLAVGAGMGAIGGAIFSAAKAN